MYKIINLNAFCKYEGKTPEIGIAVDGCFASKAWIESDEKFNDILGEKFSWYSPNDDNYYCNSKYSFSRPTEEEVIDELWANDNLEILALEKGFVLWVDEKPTKENHQKHNYIDESHWLTEDVVMPDLGCK